MLLAALFGRLGLQYVRVATKLPKTLLQVSDTVVMFKFLKGLFFFGIFLVILVVVGGGRDGFTAHHFREDREKQDMQGSDRIEYIAICMPRCTHRMVTPTISYSFA